MRNKKKLQMRMKELLEAFQQALNTEDEVEAESEKPVELKKVMIFHHSFDDEAVKCG